MRSSGSFPDHVHTHDNGMSTQEIILGNTLEKEDSGSTLDP